AATAATTASLPLRLAVEVSFDRPAALGPAFVSSLLHALSLQVEAAAAGMTPARGGAAGAGTAGEEGTAGRAAAAAAVAAVASSTRNRTQRLIHPGQRRQPPPASPLLYTAAMPRSGNGHTTPPFPSSSFPAAAGATATTAAPAAMQPHPYFPPTLAPPPAPPCPPPSQQQSPLPYNSTTPNANRQLPNHLLTPNEVSYAASAVSRLLAGQRYVAPHVV
ncbi:hypothetical protein Agub_g14341, partial [Astrephomene gubernaculifera]